MSTKTISSLSRRDVLISGAATATVTMAGPASARVVRLPTELVDDIFRLPGRVVLGNPRGDVTIAEFFDYNCGFCKRAAADIRPLLAAEPRLRYVLVNYAVLGAASVEASRVALGFSMQKIEGGYLGLHEKLFQLRGRVDAARAVALAVELGANRDKLIADADSQQVTDALVRAADLGENLGLSATPSFVAGREGVIGYIDISGKRKAIANLRKCEAIGC